MDSADTTSPYPTDPLPAAAPLTVLVVDDDRTNRLVLRSILVRFNFLVIEAENGRAAVEACARTAPDLVLMDVMMPVMDGYEATRIIKDSTADRFLPVIFLTAVTNEEALARCVQCGGDDFLVKPYSRTILKARIDAQIRSRALQDKVREQRDEIICHHSRLQQEHEFAERLFTSILQTGNLGAANIRYRLQPKAICNGDFILAAQRPSGGQHVLVGDFTGHGLAAAIGALPTEDIFYAMTAKDFGIEEIAKEINKKLFAKLNRGMFLAACLIETSADRKSMKVWNSGLPDALLYRVAGATFTRLSSTHLPLGIGERLRADEPVDVVAIEQGDRVFLYTDGVIEATDIHGRIYGQSRLEAVIRQGAAEEAFDHLVEDIAAFGIGKEQDDDITLVEVVVDAATAAGTAQGTVHKAEPACWTMDYRLDPDMLRNEETIGRILETITTLCPQSLAVNSVSMILTELYSNALDHGLLGLESARKSTPEGFASYFEERAAALAELKDGYISVGLRYNRAGTEHTLVLRVEDSGPGFDTVHMDNDVHGVTAYRGRGIGIVRNLCRRVTYSGGGRVVDAEYAWSA
jgi:CheY-like chemotaxis protein